MPQLQTPLGKSSATTRLGGLEVRRPPKIAPHLERRTQPARRAKALPSVSLCFRPLQLPKSDHRRCTANGNLVRKVSTDVCLCQPAHRHKYILSALFAPRCNYHGGIRSGIPPVRLHGEVDGRFARTPPQSLSGQPVGHETKGGSPSALAIPCQQLHPFQHWTMRPQPLH